MCVMSDTEELLRSRFGIDLPNVYCPPEVAPLLDRRVTRRYTEQPVPNSLLDALLAAAQSAPTKSDLQQYSVVVMRDAARIKQIADWIGTMDWIARESSWWVIDITQPESTGCMAAA
jgi:nitroreductase/FMN reductase [NAD(P)H]